MTENLSNPFLIYMLVMIWTEILKLLHKMANGPKDQQETRNFDRAGGRIGYRQGSFIVNLEVKEGLVNEDRQKA